MNAINGIKPKLLRPVPGEIPSELKQLPRWVSWSLEYRHQDWTKQPRTIDGGAASSTDPATWAPFDAAVQHQRDGIGFVFTDDDSILGIDLDDARDPETGEPKPWAKQILDRFSDTYAEVSPSGTGFKLFCRGVKPGPRCKTGYADGAVEIYDSGRFFTVTGHRYADATAVADCSESVAWFYDLVFPQKAEKPKTSTQRPSGDALPDDEELLAIAFNASNGPKLHRLYHGEHGDYASRSEADLALASILVFYTGPDAARLERLMRGSGLARDKWDREGDSYFARTISKAIDDAREFYTPREKAEAAKVEQAEPTQEWDDPLPLPGLPSVAPFDFDLLPDAFRGFCRDASERMQCPPDYIAAAMIVALGSVIAGQVAIRPKERDDWTEQTNLWGGIIGRPGVLKSPALAEAMRFLKRMEAEERELFVEAAREWKKKDVLRKAKAKATESAIAKAVAKGGDADALAEQFVQEQEADQQPARRRYLTNDGTVEKLGAILSETERNILSFRDELTGWLRGLDKAGNEASRAFYLEAWSGSGSFTFDRIGRGTVDIPFCSLSVFGGIQPGPLSEYLLGASTGGRGDDGLIQRFALLVWPDIPKGWRNVDRYPDTAAKNAAHDVFRRMADIDPSDIGATIEDGSRTPYVRFDAEAQREFNAWRSILESRLRSGTMPAVLESHLAKFRKLVPALSLILHLADGGNGSIRVEAIRKAVAWADYLETHARRIYGAAINPARESARSLLVKIRAGDIKDSFTARDVYIHEWTGLQNREQVEPAVRLLCELGWLREEVEKKTKPKILYRINPAATNEGGIVGSEGCRFVENANHTRIEELQQTNKTDKSSFYFKSSHSEPCENGYSSNRQPTDPTYLDADEELEVF